MSKTLVTLGIVGQQEANLILLRAKYRMGTCFNIEWDSMPYIIMDLVVLVTKICCINYKDLLLNLGPPGMRLL